MHSRRTHSAAAPSTSTPEEAAYLSDRDHPCQIIRLASEGDVETWLDLTTGRQLVGRVQREERDTHVTDTPLIEIAAGAVEANGWSFERPDEQHLLTYPVTGQRAAYRGAVMVAEERRCVMALCTFAPRIPADRLPAIAEAVARANFGMYVGGFELDFGSGLLRFRSGADVEGGLLTVEMVRDMIGVGVYMCDRYHDAFMRVAFGVEAPAAAIEQAEAA
jgi:hypothetical protein